MSNESDLCGMIVDLIKISAESSKVVSKIERYGEEGCWNSLMIKENSEYMKYCQLLALKEDSELKLKLSKEYLIFESAIGDYIILADENGKRYCGQFWCLAGKSDKEVSEIELNINNKLVADKKSKEYCIGLIEMAKSSSHIIVICDYFNSQSLESRMIDLQWNKLSNSVMRYLMNWIEIVWNELIDLDIDKHKQCIDNEILVFYKSSHMNVGRHILKLKCDY